MKRFLNIVFTAAALALMIFTKGAVLISSPGPGKFIRTVYSYFNPITLGNGNLPPFITAILTCFLLVLGFAALKSRKAAIALCILGPVTVIVSLLPLLYGIRYYSLLGVCVTLALLLSTVCAIWAMGKKKPSKPTGLPPAGTVPPTGNPPPPPPAVNR